MSETAGQREPFWLKCGGCQHVWIGTYLPMELMVCASILKAARCPMCGIGPKQVFVAKQKSGVLQEPADS